MLRIDWKDQWLAVARLVFSAGDLSSYARLLTAAARRDGLAVAGPNVEPRPGDFWIGCHPVGGWSGADPDLVGWASLVEVPVAVAAVGAGVPSTAGRAAVGADAEAAFVAPFQYAVA